MKVNPKVAIELDKPRMLWLNFNAMATFEDKTGRSFFQAFSNPSASDIRAAVWAGVLYEDKTLTIEKVGEAMGAGNITYYLDKILEAWNLGLPEKKESKNEENLSSGTG